MIVAGSGVKRVGFRDLYFWIGDSGCFYELGVVLGMRVYLLGSGGKGVVYVFIIIYIFTYIYVYLCIYIYWFMNIYMHIYIYRSSQRSGQGMWLQS